MTNESNLNHDIFQRMKSGEPIRIDDPDYEKIQTEITRAIRITGEMNSAVQDVSQIRTKISELIGIDVDLSTVILPPFYSDFGRFINLGKNVFVNHACTFMDRGGITIEDDVLIGPKVNLITENHPIDPQNRKSVVSTPIIIKKNAWIGAGAIILPGVTIGINSVVAAGSVVSRSVPDNQVVAGVPARFVKKIA